jgi:hypothetical protein
MTVAEYNQYPAKNEKGEWATFVKGKFTGYAPMAILKSGGLDILVPTHTKPILEQMVLDAAKDKVNLTIAKGFVTLTKQIEIRRLFIKEDFKDKINNIIWLLTANTTCFIPEVGFPGWSNHQNITFPAVDFNVSITDARGKRIGYLPSFNWLAQNAHKYGFIRTVLSEGWHWEYRPGVGKFDKVHESHITWTKPL